MWLDVVALSATDALRDLPDSVTRSDAAWRSWYDSEAPERAAIPDFQTRISKFTRMCIVKVGSCACLPGRLCGERGAGGWRRGSWRGIGEG